jgi:DNA-binding NtrC family response regulator
VTNVLILAREDIIAALLGLLVELRGFRPIYAKRDENAVEACERTACQKIVIDCDHSAYSPRALTTLKNAGICVILFSPSRIEADVRDAANKHRFSTFTLPIGPEAFGKLLDA